MAGVLDGMRVAFVVANEGVEQAELTAPWAAVRHAGGEPHLVATGRGQVQAMQHLDKADTFPVDDTTADARADDFDAVMLPGGVANPDQLRTDDAAVAFLRAMVDAGKPVAAICHAPWALVEAGVVRGRTLTSWPSVRTDIANAGGHWVDREVQICRDGPNVLLTSRKPDDLPAFCRAVIEVFQESRQRNASRL